MKGGAQREKLLVGKRGLNKGRGKRKRTHSMSKDSFSYIQSSLFPEYRKEMLSKAISGSGSFLQVGCNDQGMIVR